MAPEKIAGALHKLFDKYEAAGAIALNDTISMFKIPVDARIFSAKLSADNMGSTGDLDIGFHKVVGRDGLGDVVSADALGADVDVNAAAIDNSELISLDEKGQRAWELAGLSAKPDYGEFIVSITAAEATTAAGGIALEIDYVKG